MRNGILYKKTDVKLLERFTGMTTKELKKVETNKLYDLLIISHNEYNPLLHPPLA